MEPGKEYYKLVRKSQVRRYIYICIHPTNRHYHILLDMWTKDPVRFYEPDLNNLFTDKKAAYERALELVESDLVDLKQQLKELETNKN